MESEQALLNLHKDAIAEENRVVEEREDLREQLKETESNYLAIIANMKVVSLCIELLIPRVPPIWEERKVSCSG